MQATSGTSASSRSRLVSLGAVVAMAISAGGVLSSSASSDVGSASVFIPITPCRLMDTRAADGRANVGARAVPISAGETYPAMVWGTNGNCTIPVTATAVSMNVTFVNPSAVSYLTVYPPDAALPVTSNLNWGPGQAPAPNAVTSRLSDDGRIGFFNHDGNVDLIADIVGYYQSAAGGTPGPAGPAGPVPAPPATR